MVPVCGEEREAVGFCGDDVGGVLGFGEVPCLFGSEEVGGGARNGGGGRGEEVGFMLAGAIRDELGVATLEAEKASLGIAGREDDRGSPPLSPVAVVEAGVVWMGGASGGYGGMGNVRVGAEGVVEREEAAVGETEEMAAFEGLTMVDGVTVGPPASFSNASPSEAALVAGSGGGEAKSGLVRLLGSMALSRSLSAMVLSRLASPSKAIQEGGGQGDGVNGGAKVGLGIVLDSGPVAMGKSEKLCMEENNGAVAASPSKAALVTGNGSDQGETSEVVNVEEGMVDPGIDGLSSSDAASGFEEQVDVDNSVQKLVVAEIGGESSGPSVGSGHTANKDEHVVKEEEKVMQCSDGKRSTTEEVFHVEEQANSAEWTGAKDELAVEDREEVARCVRAEQGASMDDPAVEEQKLVEQGISEQQKVAIEELGVGGEKAVVVNDRVSGRQGTTESDLSMEDQEKVVKQDVVDEWGATMDGIAAQENVVDQCVSDEWRASKDDIAVEDQEKVVEEGIIDEWGATKDDIAVEGQGKVVEYYVSDESRATKDDDAVEDQEKVVEQGVIHEWGATKDDIAVEDQRVVEQSSSDVHRAIKDDVALDNQGNIAKQCISDVLRATKDKVALEDQEEVVERVYDELGAATEYALAPDVASSGGVSGISSSEVVPVTGNGSDEGIVKNKVKVHIAYPQRPGKLNCPSYMTTWSCMYGLSCHFNHPLLNARLGVPSFPSEQGNSEVSEFVVLNRLGLPFRQGVRNCAYYMRNGICRYGKRCHFNHPDQVFGSQLCPPTGWEDNASPSSLNSKQSSDHAASDNTESRKEVLLPNILQMLLPPQKLATNTEEKVMKDPKWSSSDGSDECCSADSSDGPLCKQEWMEYPERPGRRECPFYMRYGNRKFASSCNYHHPKGLLPNSYCSKDPSLGKEQMEYPERPGEPECPFYMKHGRCKFGASCKFHHPKNLSQSRRGPTIPKKPFASDEHRSTSFTLQDHMCPQEEYPERPGEPECRYYMQFGKCKYLSACIFHHPKDQLPSGRSSHSDAHSMWHPANTSRSDDLCQQEQVEKPSMPECPFYMKNGTCQFGSACEFYHPNDRRLSMMAATDDGIDMAYDNFSALENILQQQEQTIYPERPGQPECSYYMKHGCCKFQMNCKYHHPKCRLPKKLYQPMSLQTHPWTTLEA